MANSKPTLPALVKKADKVFSEYIRRRDSTTYIEDENGYSRRAGPCVTCGKIVPSEGKGTGHCGHFIERGCKLTRFEPTNANLQCGYCNTYKSGEQYRHGLAIDRKHGKGTAEALHDLSEQYKREGYKFTRQELEDIIEIYKRKLGEL